MPILDAEQYLDQQRRGIQDAFIHSRDAHPSIRKEVRRFLSGINPGTELTDSVGSACREFLYAGAAYLANRTEDPSLQRAAESYFYAFRQEALVIMFQSDIPTTIRRLGYPEPMVQLSLSAKSPLQAILTSRSDGETERVSGRVFVAANFFDIMLFQPMKHLVT